MVEGLVLATDTSRGFLLWKNLVRWVSLGLYQKLSSGGGRQNNFCRESGGGQIKICPGPGWRGHKTCHVLWVEGGILAPATKELAKNLIHGVNCVRRVEGGKEKICPEGGGGIEKNMS